MNELTVRQGHTKRVCTISESYVPLRNCVGSWTLCGKREKITASHLTWFQCGFGLGRNLLLNIGPTRLRAVLPIFALTSVQTCLGAPGRGSFRKKGVKKTFSSCGNACLLMTSLRLVIGRHTFSALASLPLFTAVSMIPNMWHSRCHCVRHSCVTILGVISLNQLVSKYRSLHL